MQRRRGVAPHATVLGAGLGRLRGGSKGRGVKAAGDALNLAAWLACQLYDHSRPALFGGPSLTAAAGTRRVPHEQVFG